MANQNFFYGLGVSCSITVTNGPTLVVIESFDNAGSGDVFELHGNNTGQTVIATRVSNIKDTMQFVAECSTYVRAMSLIGKACVVTFKDDSTVQGPSGQLSGPTAVGGKITIASLAGGRGPWQYNITMICDAVA
jgi:hypothetical protein